MKTSISYLFKIVALSLFGSLFIKYGAAKLSVAPSATHALIGVFLLPLGMGIALALRKPSINFD